MTPLAQQYSEATKNDTEIAECFKNFMKWGNKQSLIPLGNSKIDGYIVHGYLKKNTEKTNILFGKIFFKRYYVVNFDLA